MSQLEQHARALAGRRTTGRVRQRDHLLRRLADNEGALSEAYGHVTDAVNAKEAIPPAAEWFIDNYPLVEQNIRTARRHLPRGYSRELPRLINGPTAGSPRIYDLTFEFISHAHGRVDAESLRAFVAAYQTIQPLGLGELWAVPIMLRLALLENLRRVMAIVTDERTQRQRADSWIDRMIETATEAPARVVLVLAEMVNDDPPLTDAFVAQFATRLQGQGAPLMFSSSWLEQRLAERGDSAEQVFRRVSQSQAADQVSIGNSIGSLRFLGATDWRGFVEGLSVVEGALRLDPAGVYAGMDFTTRDSYRHVVERLAKRCKRTEQQVAEKAVALSIEATDPRQIHVGYFLVGEGRDILARGCRGGAPKVGLSPRKVRRGPMLAYVTAIVFVTGWVSALLLSVAPLGGLAEWIRIAFVVLFVTTTSQFAIALVHWVATLWVTPLVMPRLDFSKGIPPEQMTLVAVPTLLTDLKDIQGLLESLEVRYLANRDPQLRFALVTDFRDAPQATLQSDDALLGYARTGIEALNTLHTEDGKPPFFLLHRPRRWNPSEGVWMGWERKRGKIEELNAALRGDSAGFETVVGDLKDLQGVAYVLVLDSDTLLPRDTAAELAGTMAHPLNRPRYDPEYGRVVEGHAILQPRVIVTMASASKSRFARLNSGEPGIDPYTRAVSDVYQDVFGEGSFVGKGIYDVDAFREVTAGRIPENRVLSHDLLEGALARAGLVSDILLYEDYPSSYAADVTRRARWMRGDWQIAAWLSRRVPSAGRRTTNPLSVLSQWKILDNLRRSLVPIALLLLLLFGWFVPGTALFASVTVLSLLLLPGIIAAATELTRRLSEPPQDEQYLREIAATLGRQLLREALTLTCLVYDAYVSLVCIVRTLVRLNVTRRHLLEWQTASDVQANTRTKNVRGSYVSMAIAPLSAVAIAIPLGFMRPNALPFALPILGLWILAPALTWWLSQPYETRTLRVDRADVSFLRRVARRTWHFFEAFVNGTEHDLPPDNFQEVPDRGIAHRTSPTNIGLSLCATLTAYDFGYVSAGDVLERTKRTLSTLDRLQRYRGHFYNWYDTRSLQPLLPMYVSTVDSGNLAGHLITVASGLRGLADEPILRPQVFSGLLDTLDVMQEESSPVDLVEETFLRLRSDLETPPKTTSGAFDLLSRLISITQDTLRTSIRSSEHVLARWVTSFEAQCHDAKNELRLFAPWAMGSTTGVPWSEFGEAFASLEEPRTVAETAALDGTVARAIEVALTDAEGAEDESSQRRIRALMELRESVVRAVHAARIRLVELREVATRCSALADFDVEFLYDRGRHLLSIGYNVGEHRLDAGFYDLLASEARLASFVAIAQRKLPQEHWFHLGRLLTAVGGRSVLVSWSGSMFEYLMPLLVMPTYARTILDETYRGVVSRQIEFGRQHGVPWGVSESGYSKTDARLNYQYRAFGVPGLGFKRGLADDLVVAPYASAMALMVDPQSACQNLRRLAQEGQLGTYGFYEAIDYTPARLPSGKDRVTVQSYMAHHQGMVFLSLAYALLDRPMQRRFQAVPAFRATDLLLQERVPHTSAIFPHPAEVTAGGEIHDASGQSVRVFRTPDTPAPAVQLLSNGTYHVAVTNAGGGYSRWRDIAVTRWHEDPTCDAWGTFGYLRDVESGEFWSVAHQPTLTPATQYEAVFAPWRAEFRRRDMGIDSHVEISVSPEDDVELRRISLTNLGRTPRTLELTSFAEVVLAPPGADTAHPAFSNLFVQTEILREQQAILCTRRPRSADVSPPWMLHLMAVSGEQVGMTSFETSRGAFIGRGRGVSNPAAMHRASLENTEGSVLDPVVAIRGTMVIQPEETIRIHMVTGVAESREGALALVTKYSERHSAERVFELSWTHNQVLMRRLNATEADTRLYEQLASNILYCNGEMRAPRGTIMRNRSGQSALWPHSISGDLPIALVRISDREHLGLVGKMVQAHAYWRIKGVSADLVIWNEDPSIYRQALQDEILSIIGSHIETSLLDRPGGIFLRRSEQLSEDDKVLMQTVARLIVGDTGGSFAAQATRRAVAEVEMPAFVPLRQPNAGETLRVAASLPARNDLKAWNGHGGFTPDGREYVIVTQVGARTPAPWVNVLANPYFGTVVSESGGAYTWCENARRYRLTPWHNDPVCDVGGEAFYIRDEIDGSVWSPTPLPASGTQAYTTRHGFGYTVFEYTQDGISSELHTFVAVDAPLKFMRFTLKNTSGRPRRLSLTGFYELVLGEDSAVNRPHVVTEVDLESGALFARNAYSNEFSSRVAFLDCSGKQRSHSGSRHECIGRNRTLANPACMSRTRLSGRVGAGLDPCLAMQTMIEIADGESHEVVFIFGSGRDLNDARTLVHRYHSTAAAHAALEQVWATWGRILGAVHVQTPDVAVNFLVNGWLLYQVIASRLWGRSGFYQSGGAFGFRDQLQDAMALVHAEPFLLREQILRAAQRQFREGDVQHWWHPPMGQGVRTHVSDDYLFLPNAVCRYVGTSGDTGVLDEIVSFLEGRGVEPREDSYYDLPSRSEEQGSIYEHCVRAIRHGLRFGEHGLPLMGSGDWNDGMNLVGEEGRGESVWLGFFLYDVLLQFETLARSRNDDVFADLCLSEAKGLQVNIEKHAWDGEWYRRAYFDSGEPLGSSSNPECQIDSLSQSWSVLSGAGDPTRTRAALASLDRHLVRRDLGLIALFTPPFDTSSLNPGYIKGYVPGVRENGGQYTHAAVWAVMAFAAAGEVERAWELFSLIQPIGHGQDAEGIATYEVEPYVMAADVYTNDQHAGRGGWTWYTGAAGWMYRLAVESLLGLNLEVDRLRVTPLMPAAWESFDVRYRYHGSMYAIHVRNLGGGGRHVNRVVCDDVEQPDRTIPLVNDGVEHRVLVEISVDGQGL